MKKELEMALSVLQAGGVIVYPTDTVWGIGCDATNTEAVSRIYRIKKREDSKSMIILVEDPVRLGNHIIKLGEQTLQHANNPERPTTIIYKGPIGLAPNVVSSDNTVAIRIVQEEFCRKLIRAFGKPIVSTSANISGYPTPMSYQEIDDAILNAVDYRVNLHREVVSKKSSTILRVLEDGSLDIIRP